MSRSPIIYNVSSDSDSDDLPDIIEQAGGTRNYFTENINQSLILFSDEDDLPDLDGGPAYVSSSASLSSQLSTISSSVSSVTGSSITKPKFQVTKPKEVKKRKGQLSAQETAQKLEKKEAARLEKEIKKQEEERAKAVRKATTELQRSVKPGESIKVRILLYLESILL
jgi:hypothetical protein